MILFLSIKNRFYKYFNDVYNKHWQIDWPYHWLMYHLFHLIKALLHICINHRWCFRWPILWKTVSLSTNGLNKYTHKIALIISFVSKFLMVWNSLKTLSYVKMWILKSNDRFFFNQDSFNRFNLLIDLIANMIALQREEKILNWNLQYNHIHIHTHILI